MPEQADQTVTPVPEYENYKTKTPLTLPFKGVWEVVNGGRTLETNDHLRAPIERIADQRFAYDFVRPYQNDGWQLSDYQAFGAEVIAPGNGVIAQVVDGSFDLPIGERDANVITGNMIIIDHQNGEFSTICHFMHDSIKVKVGDRVNQGDFLGQCGNSGNTDQPHIHYQLQNALLLHKAQGLPAQFRNIMVNEELKENQEPVRGDKVSNS